ncbi:MAG: hypothetical protein ACD_9C00095G0003 [uncultured bacterium]|nr:MAG: hypothetical protein ACD_9C00095G0003 [uncultured bacterium]
MPERIVSCSLETMENEAVSRLRRNSPGFVNKKIREKFLAELQDGVYGQALSTVITEIYLGEQSKNVDNVMLRQDYQILVDFVNNSVKVMNANVLDEVCIVKQLMAEFPQITFIRMLQIVESKHFAELLSEKSIAESDAELLSEKSIAESGGELLSEKSIAERLRELV